MKALVSGASSGIGKDIARELAQKGVDLVLVARTLSALEELKEELETNYHIHVSVEAKDLSNLDNLKELKDKYPDIDILVNNAGFGYVGDFNQIPLDTEMKMIDLNIKALHYLTKIYYQDFINSPTQKYILNVGSIASFLIGPKMITYYGTKNYVLEFSRALNYEAKKNKYPVSVSCLCPGPTKTKFDDVAHVKFSLKGASSSLVAKKAVQGMFKKKNVILPAFKLKLLAFISRLTPPLIMESLVYRGQNSKVSQD